MKKKVMVAGHICIDITPVIPGEKITCLEQILQPGKLFQTKGVDVHTGGAVANTGLAMKIMGADVSLAGKIGQDAFGSMILDNLKAYQADGDMIRSETDTTSYSIVLAPPGMDRMFLHDPGANDHFSSEDITDEMLEETALFHFGYPPLMRQMFLSQGEELIRLFQRVKQKGIATSLDLAAVDPSSEAGKVAWRKVLERVLPYVDFFVPSVEELMFMLEPERYEYWQKRANGQDMTRLLSIEEDVAPLADTLLEMGAKVVLIKCGAPGMYYCTGKKERLQKIGERLSLDFSDWSQKSGFERSYTPSCVRSGTGAGDTSIAAFLTALLEGDSLEECVQLASAAGAACVEAYDALGGLCTLEELRARIRKGWAKQDLL